MKTETRIKQSIDSSKEASTKQTILTVAVIFITSLSALLYVYTSFPELTEDERQHMKLPLHIEEAKNLGKLLGRYKDLYYFQVLAGLFVTYIFMQLQCSRSIALLPPLFNFGT
ncbi:Transmembrane protein 41 like protein [Eufriesea mexicana]|nr:Transmembrane protein 41 like protein [Eufriesea mexicana]